MKGLHALWGDRVQFLDILIRQAHPGPGVPPYSNFEQKMRDAETWQREEAIPYPVLADELAGTVHQAYGGLADPSYLIDSDGFVSFYNLWTHAPTLHRAIEELLARNGRGVVRGGWDRKPHVAAAMTDGWRGLRRGLPQSLLEIETAMPASGIAPFLGYQLRPLLAPLTLRPTPLPSAAKVALAAAVAGAALALAARRHRTRR